jgi:membrane protease YdiL (CAAX protease family)
MSEPAEEGSRERAATGTVAARRAFSLFFAAWLASLVVLAVEGRSLAEPLMLAAIFGVALPGLALFVCRGLPWRPSGPPRAGEGALLVALAASVTLYLATKSAVLAAITPAGGGPRLDETFDALAELVAFVAVPLVIYRLVLGRTPRDFGLAWPPGSPETRRRSWLAFGALGTAFVAIQLLVGAGARPLVDGSLAGRHWILGLVLAFVWMSIEAGVVEETFFRVILQARLAALARSPVAGLFLSALVFGLAHAPGLYLRGAGALDGIGEAPSLAVALASSVTTMGVAGLVFGVLWLRTRNWLLVVALHGLLDALSNAPAFMDRWGL